MRTLPCFFVALLNPPVLSLIFKNSSLDYSGTKMAWYALTFAAECVAVAAFEETLFRGAVFLTVLENRRGDGKRIFASVAISSAIFAAAHLLNLFTSSPGAVLLQTGYSFLLGGMCAYTLLRTKNISFCVALHAIFNFCGTLTEKFGREFPDLVNDVKLNHRQPLFVEIPDRHGTGRKPDFITAYVNEAIGLKL